MLLLLGCTAAVAEPVQQGVLPMKDIREFGAIGDGRVDDTSAIQAALQGGGLIVVPAGRYLTGTLYLESDTELRLAPVPNCWPRPIRPPTTRHNSLRKTPSPP